MNDVFSGCENLKEIPAGLFRNNTRLGYIQCAFSGCSSLTSLPEGLFANCPGIQSVSEINSVMEPTPFLELHLIDRNPGRLVRQYDQDYQVRWYIQGCTSLRRDPKAVATTHR